MKQRGFKLYRTVNQARILWDSRAKPSGLLAGHLNIRSAIPKSEQLQHLLYESNLDFLCLTETWLHENSPADVLKVHGYNMFRRDRAVGRGGGVLFYVKDKIVRKIQSCINDLECVGLKLTLSAQMSFIIIGIYRPPSAKNVFYKLNSLIKECDTNKEIILLGERSKFDFQQVIEGPTRITSCSETLIDLAFTNRSERIKKSYNLVTGLSDHNMILILI